MTLNSKIIVGLERISEVFKSLLWEKAKIHNISPIQIRILLFVSSHETDLCNISYLAKELNVTKPTISDAVKVLLQKEFLEKDFSPTDNRRYNLLLTSKGKSIFRALEEYTLPISDELDNFSEKELTNLFKTITKLIYQLNQKGIIQVQRTCFNCRFYKGNKTNKHFCNLMNQKLVQNELRLDCAEFEEKLSGL